MLLILLTPACILQTRTRVLQALIRAGKIIRYSYKLLHVMRIINRSMVSLISNKMSFFVNRESKFSK